MKSKLKNPSGVQLKENTVVAINTKTRTENIWDSHLIFAKSSQHQHELNEQLAIQLGIISYRARNIILG